MAIEWNRLMQPLKDRLPGLKPDRVWDAELDRQIAAASLGVFGYEAGAQRAYAIAVKSGLHLWNDSLAASHTLSQEIHNPTGSYWHGVMHRMEGDYGNAKYWFRQVGRHEGFPRVRKRAELVFKQWQVESEQSGVNGGVLAANMAESVAGAGRIAEVEALVTAEAWDPYRFIDLVEEQVRFGRSPALMQLLLRIQREEFAVLLGYSLHHSGGGELELD